MPNDTAPARQTLKLSPAVIQRLATAKRVEQAAEAELARAKAHTNDLIAVAFDVAGAPPTAVIDVESGSIIWPADVDQNGVSTDVPSTPVTA